MPSLALSPSRAATSKSKSRAIAQTCPSIWKLLKIVATDRPKQEELSAVSAWLRALNHRHHYSVGEHTLLLLATQNGFFSRRLPDLEGSAALALRASWEALSGKTMAVEPGRLPSWILARESELSRLLYESAFLHGQRLPLFRKSAAGFFARFQASSLFNLSLFFWSLSALLLLAHPEIRSVMLGFFCGVLGASLNEYTVHLGIGHASDRLAAIYRHGGWGGRYAEEVVLAHRVHHAKMQTDFRAEFSRSTTRARVDRFLEKETRLIVEGRVAEKVTPAAMAEAEMARIQNDVKAGGYGVNGTTIGCITMQALALPYFLLNILLAQFLGGAWFLLPATFTLSAFIAQSMYSHRYLHLSLDDQERMEAKGELSRFMMWFMRSPIGRLQVRRHYRHHQEKMGYAQTVNGAIMSFNSADYLLRGGVAEAEVLHLLSMHAEGFL